MGVSKASVCRSVHRVVNAVNIVKFREVIDWPVNPVTVALDFYAVAGFPNIFGVVDGTLINIDGPKQNEVDFVD